MKLEEDPDIPDEIRKDFQKSVMKSKLKLEIEDDRPQEVIEQEKKERNILRMKDRKKRVVKMHNKIIMKRQQYVRAYSFFYPLLMLIMFFIVL